MEVIVIFNTDGRVFHGAPLQVARVMEGLHAGVNVLVAIQRADDDEGNNDVNHLLLTVSEITKALYSMRDNTSFSGLLSK